MLRRLVAVKIQFSPWIPRKFDVVRRKYIISLYRASQKVPRFYNRTRAALSHGFVFAGPQPRAAQAIQIDEINGRVGGTRHCVFFPKLGLHSMKTGCKG